MMSGCHIAKPLIAILQMPIAMTEVAPMPALTQNDRSIARSKRKAARAALTSSTSPGLDLVVDVGAGRRGSLFTLTL